MRFTPLDAEAALTQEIALWVQDYRLKSPVDRGKYPVPVEVVQGFIPSYQAGPQMPMQNKAPAIAVRVSHGTYRRLKGEVAIDCIVLVWDDDLSRQGYRDCMNLVNNIVTGIYEARTIARAFPVLDEPVTWTLVEDPSKDFFPYFVAGVQVHLGVQTPDPNAAPYDVIEKEKLILRPVPG
jgi:hypothetical protein